MISRQLSVILLILGESLCFLWQIIRENLCNLRLPFTQNKPISKPGKIAISDCLLRTKNNELRTGAAKNKPKQTHFLQLKFALICDYLSQKSFQKARFMLNS